MAVSTLVAQADVENRLKEVSTNVQTTLLTEIIETVSHRFEGALKRKLLTTTHTAETYDGNGTDTLYVKQWPVTAVASASIEDESSIDTTSTDVFRFRADGRFVLQGRVWSKPTQGRIDNVTVTYTAGYADIDDFRDYDAMPDAWEMLVETCVQLYRDWEAQRRGIASEGNIDGNVTYFKPFTITKGWVELKWTPVVNLYRRRSFQLVG